jgi:hypothetical protein
LRSHGEKIMTQVETENVTASRNHLERHVSGQNGRRRGHGNKAGSRARRNSGWRVFVGNRLPSSNFAVQGLSLGPAPAMQFFASGKEGVPARILLTEISPQRNGENKE